MRKRLKDSKEKLENNISPKYELVSSLDADGKLDGDILDEEFSIEEDVKVDVAIISFVHNKKMLVPY